MRTEGEELRLTAAPLASAPAPASATAPTRAGRWRWLPRWCLAVLPLVFLWGALINQLRVEWEVNPQYAHGWIVPLLCLSLIFGRWEKLAGGGDNSNPSDETPSQATRFWIFACLAILAFLWLPTRLVQEANPEWRMISWVMAVEVICLTLGVIWLQKGGRAALTMAFPFCFFLVAVPWPTLIEGPLIQLLTRICAAFTIEIAGWMDIPAVQHGNIIELATGSLGIDEACSGIRSFQSTLMISLFLGDFYGLALIRRIVLVPVGFALALAFNICRTSFLTYVAGRQGVPAVAKYHDPVGMTIMIACLVAMWLLILLFRGRSSTPPPPPKPIRLGLFPRPSAALGRLAVGLGIWLALSETAVALWYGAHEWGVPFSQSWTVDWPRNNLTYVEKPISEKTKTLLRYDEAVTAAWKEDDATQWTMTYLRWLPGRIAVHLAKVHTPDVCLTAVGNSVETLPDISYLTVRGLRMPFREYILTQGAQPAYVFYCLWEDRAESQFFKTEYLTYDNRLAPVLAGRRNCGQRSIEIVVQGCNDLKGAENALVQELNKVLKVEQTPVKPAA